jgi:hypothetical protein
VSHDCSAAAGPITAATLPGIERLTALEDLELVSCDLEPACLQSLSARLTSLHVCNVALRPTGSEALQDSVLGSAQLLQVLAPLPALEVLELDRIKGEWLQQMSEYAAITASSNLQELCIRGCGMQSAAWAHVFPAGHQLPHLVSLIVEGRQACAFAASDIASLASCCPALERLQIKTFAAASLGPLKVLAGLTILSIGPVKPAAIRNDLAALSQLQDLEVSVSLPAAAAGEDESAGLQHLVPLAALTGLMWFCSPTLGLRLSSRVSVCHAERRDASGQPASVRPSVLQTELC